MKSFVKTIMKISNYIDTLYNYLVLKSQNVKYGKDLVINGKIYCVANSKNSITLGDNVRINSRLGSNPVGGSTRTILFAKGNAKITIGSNTGISNSAVVAHESISIGSNVLIGGNVKIYDTDFHAVYFEERNTTDETVVTKPVIIEDDVFIGAHTIILKGVIIGKGSVIGAGSVVSKSVPPNEIWAGNPARCVKTL